jgi:orotate phosphoribosyltransferase
MEREAAGKNIAIRVVGICLGVDRQQTTACYDASGKVIPGKKGVDAIRKFTEKTGIPVYSLAPISEVMDYLYAEQIPVLIDGDRQPISPSVKKIFDAYRTEYGTLP